MSARPVEFARLPFVLLASVVAGAGTAASDRVEFILSVFLIGLLVGAIAAELSLEWRASVVGGET